MNFTSAKNVLEWLRANPDEPFGYVWSGGRLFCGFRSDEGELDAFECAIAVHEGDMVRAKRTKGKGKSTKIRPVTP